MRIGRPVGSGTRWLLVRRLTLRSLWCRCRCACASCVTARVGGDRCCGSGSVAGSGSSSGGCGGRCNGIGIAWWCCGGCFAARLLLFHKVFWEQSHSTTQISFPPATLVSAQHSQHIALRHTNVPIKNNEKNKAIH